MEKVSPDQAIKELTLLMMYLTRFNELGRSEICSGQNLAWKGYSFDAINELADQELIWQGSRRAKTVELTEKGLELARDLLVRYNIADWNRP